MKTVIMALISILELAIVIILGYAGNMDALLYCMMIFGLEYFYWIVRTEWK